MLKSRWFIVVLIVSFYLTFSATYISRASAPLATPTPTTSTPPPPLAKTYWGYDPLVELPPLHTPTKADSLSTPQNLGVFNSVKTWSKLVFQSYRDNNWEIYLADGAGQNPIRLTANPATDAYPNLNLSIGRIVFASRRDGDYEIFSMELDGSDLRQLTFNSVTDIYPVWSPDGTQIVFQSYPNGVSEIYTMNGDGNNVVALTSDGQGSVNPSWSLNGTQIVFGGYRSGQYAIWQMNADGSGPIQLGSALPYAIRPLYSPDGKYIAFSADGNGDGFLELWAMNANGSSQHIVYDTKGQLGGYWDTWMSGWSPMVSGSWYPQPPADAMSWIGFTAISYVYYQGNWYWNYGYPRATRPDCGACVIEQLVDNGVDWHASWSFADTVPPVATLASLPEYSRCAGTTIRWDSHDLGQIPSGVLWYFVEYRVGNGAWTPWVQAPGPYVPGFSEAVFRGACGTKVAFRVRAEDFAYQTSMWTPDNQAPSTWLFSTLLTSTVRDARGWLLPTATLAFTPTQVGPVEMHTPGNYLARLSLTGTTSIDVSAPGYGVRPAYVQDYYTDSMHAFDLPPTDDLIQNGNFEVANGSLTNWDSDGDTAPAVITSTAHLGQAAVKLTSHLGVELSAAETLTQVVGSNPQLEATPDGTLHLAVQNGSGIYYTYRTSSGGWSTPELITTTSAIPSLAVTTAGEVHLAWVDGSMVFHTFQHPDGYWATPEVIASGLLDPAVVIAVDKLDGIHLLFYYRATPTFDFNGGLVICHRTSDGIWQPCEGALFTFRLVGENLQLAVGPDGNVRVMARADDYAGYIWQGVRSDAWHWSQSFWGAKPHRLRIDNQGIPHILWQLSSTGYYSHLQSGTWGGWDASYATTAIPNYTGVGDLALDETPSAYFVESAWNGVFFRYLPLGGLWPDTQTLESAGAGKPAITRDISGTLHLIYETTPGQLSYRYSLPPLPRSYSEIRQTLNVLADMHRPTLSFYYQLQSAGAHSLPPFSVWISTGLTDTLVYSATTSTPAWSLAWADLSDWVGQTVTVTFRAESVDAPNDVSVNVDAISLGSWLTPILLNVSPTHVEALVSTTITLTGQNFLEGITVQAGSYPLADVVRIDDGTLTVTVPASMPPGIYPIWVTNPGGQAQVMTFGLQVGKELFLPLVSR